MKSSWKKWPPSFNEGYEKPSRKFLFPKGLIFETAISSPPGCCGMLSPFFFKKVIGLAVFADFLDSLFSKIRVFLPHLRQKKALQLTSLDAWFVPKVLPLFYKVCSAFSKGSVRLSALASSNAWFVPQFFKEKKKATSFFCKNLNLEIHKIKEKKKAIRVFYKKRLKKVTLDKKQKEIIRYLKRLPFFKKGGFIAGFRALSDEPCLDDFFKKYQAEMCFPVIGRTGLIFYRPDGQWKKNTFSIWEPRPLPENRVPLSSISYCLIPARAFDRKGRRLGRGGGFYDKTLADNRKKHPLSLLFQPKKPFALNEKKMSGKKDSVLFMENSHRLLKPLQEKNQPLLIGVAFAEQIHNEDLPFENHDVVVDMIVTDRFVLIPLKR